MKIKRIEILGFKSFVDRVTVDFQEGITSVVGPNGCGKSNIVDAIRWAMGEQHAKNLRGRFMEDVIFGGSETRKPLGMAEVSLIFSNADGLAPPAFQAYEEISVTRRLYRNGESEFLINKTPCRLLDISELFMDTGIGARAYSIIEQGKIGMIINSKPEDRRSLIEEAAGVTKYKSRKKTALRKIEATKQNLIRLGDIIAEVRRQLSSLKRQAQKAERYRTHREELKGIETRFARERYRELQVENETISSQERQCQLTLDGLSGQVTEQEANLETLRLRQVDREKEVTQGQERVFHLTSEIQKVEGRIEFSDKEIGNLDRQRERMTTEGEEIVRRLAELDEEEKALHQSGATLDEELESAIRRLAEGEAHLEEFAAREQDLATSLEAARNVLYTVLTELSRASSLQEEAERRLQGLKERTARNRSDAVGVREQIEESQGDLATLEAAVTRSKEEFFALQQAREKGQETIRTLRRHIEENESALLDRREELNRQRSRLESLAELEKNLEGYGPGVQLLLREPGFQDRFAGMVADALEVPAHLEAAVEAVLGDRLQSLLAPRAEDAEAALEYLRLKEGRCAFLLPGFSGSASPSFAGGTSLTDLVRPRPGAEETARALLAGVFLVDSLRPFLSGGIPPGVCLVTETGETLTGRGELTGGGAGVLNQGLLHKKREMKERSQEVDRLTKEVGALQKQREQWRADLAAAEEHLQEIEAALHRQELKLVDGEKDLLRLGEETGRFQERLEVLSLEEDQLHEEQEELIRRLAQASQGRQEQERQKIGHEETVAGRQEELQVLRRETDVVRERVTSLKVQVASIREREEGNRRSLERLEGLRKELRGRAALLQNRLTEGQEERERLQEEIARLRTELNLLFQKREEEKIRFEQIREGFETGSREIESLEETLKGLRGRANQSREELAAQQLKGRELHLEAEHLRQTILERYRMDLADEASESGEPFDPDWGERRLAELRRLIEDIGEVNLTAIDEYRELEVRWDFLTSQQEDLRQSLEGLQTAIAKINRTTRRRFRETFDQVNAMFQEVFPRLFRGGQAELKLTDEEDLLETGIDIIVQPPGKKLQSVNLLSGGEKALTAVALIFSIFLIKPSPFCLLDEVDAPLDEANIGRFNELVREMSEKSQFIIITHNKRTMEMADILYGVTMEEPGVSKLVSVRINDFDPPEGNEFFHLPAG